MGRARGRALIAAVAALVLAGCSVSLTPEGNSSSADAPIAQPSTPPEISLERVSVFDPELVLDDPGAYVGPSTAVLGDSRVQVVSDVVDPELPVTVTSHERGGDREVVVEDASRIIAMDLAGSISATVWALGLGENLIGRDTASQFPGIEHLPVITGAGHTVNVEAILALKPSVVVTDGTIGPISSVNQLRDAGIPVVYVKNDPTFAGAEELARQVGAALGVPSSGEALAERTAAEVADAQERIAAVAPQGEDRLRMVFLYLRGSAGVYYLFGEESGADELVRAMGGIDVAQEIGLDGMKPLTDEAMLAADPDVILVMSNGLESMGGVEGLLRDKPAIALTQAGQNSRFVDMDDGQMLAFGPRSADILESLAAAVYAPQVNSA